jgi:peptidoglycan/LPS O-acetylase OafA/YrhL
VYWSLAVEEHFYFLFPLLYLGLRTLRASPRRQAVVMLLLCALILAWRCVLVLVFHSPSDRTYLASDTRFDSILFGAALAVFGNPVLDGKPRGSETLWKFVIFPLGIAGLLAALLFRDPGFRETARYSLQGLCLIPVFVVAISWPGFLPFRILNARPIAFLGVLSYSLYLTHHVVIFGLQKHLPELGKLPLLVLAFAVSFVLSYGIYRFVEKPSAQLRKRLSA